MYCYQERYTYIIDNTNLILSVFIQYPRLRLEENTHINKTHSIQIAVEVLIRVIAVSYIVYRKVSY